MCGECMEGDAINILEIEAEGKGCTPENPLICFYLQDTADLILKQGLLTKKLDVSKYVTDTAINPPK